MNYNLFRKLPYFFQNLLVTFYNCKQYSMRHGGKYREFLEYYDNAWKMSESQLANESSKKRIAFLKYATSHSSWYREFSNCNKLSEFSILKKTDIINNLDKISTINENLGILSLTGGTTGASMKVIYTKENMQERFAILDSFRKKFGYTLGKKTAWFSGKNLITNSDLNKGRCAHYDFINKINFYSTFNINEKNFSIYWNSLNKFQPEFIVGFPSSVYEIAKIAQDKNLEYCGKVKVFFPTAETVLPIHREVISKVFGCIVVDQYASSEGAPFILECEKGNKHIHPLTGDFEVVDQDFQPTNEGKMLVTSYTTYGTPLIRYDIGDSIKLEGKKRKCECGSYFPLVISIDGRSTDYILSPQYGKINLGNISNSTKDIEGIVCFQLIQNSLDKLILNIVCNDKFNDKEEIKFISSLRERVGDKINIEIKKVNEIPREASGKFRIVKNNLV